LRKMGKASCFPPIDNVLSKHCDFYGKMGLSRHSKRKSPSFVIYDGTKDVKGDKGGRLVVYPNGLIGSIIKQGKVRVIEIVGTVWMRLFDYLLERNHETGSVTVMKWNTPSFSLRCGESPEKAEKLAQYLNLLHNMQICSICEEHTTIEPLKEPMKKFITKHIEALNELANTGKSNFNPRRISDCVCSMNVTDHRITACAD